MPQGRLRRASFEYRALVAIACYFVLMQAFLGALAAGFSVGHLQIAGADHASICYGGQTTTEVPAGDQTGPRTPCGLCAFACAGGLAPVAPAEVAAAALSFAPFDVVAADAHRASAFSPRVGLARAPPVFV